MDGGKGGKGGSGGKGSRPRHDEATRDRPDGRGAGGSSRERGYHGVVVRDLCDAAGANLAAVNYYFGGKLGLYRAVLEEVLGKIRDFPILRAPPGSSAEERIRHYVLNYVPRLANPEGPGVMIQRIMSHEMQEPTELAPWIAQEVILPRARYLAEAVSELMGCALDDPRVGRCVISLQAQCHFYLPSRFRARAMPEADRYLKESLPEAAEHIVEFTLAGIRRIAGL